MSALLNGRTHANPLPPTDQVRLACRSSSTTRGSSAMIRSTSSMVGTRLLRLFERPFVDVMHRIAQVQCRHALQVVADDVNFLRIPEEVVRQIVGHICLQLCVNRLALGWIAGFLTGR